MDNRGFDEEDTQEVSTKVQIKVPEPTTPTKKDDSAKDGRQSWVNLIFLVLLLLAVSGFSTGLSTLITPIAEEFQVERTTAATGITSLRGISFLATIVINLLLERNLISAR